MPDFSKMSNDELLAIANGAPKQAVAKAPGATPDFSKLSNEELLKIVDQGKTDGAAEVNQFVDSAKEAVLKPIVKVGRAVDSYTGAPTRAAIGALQDGKNPFTAFGSQFGADPDQAPTGKQIAAKAGLSEEDSIRLPFRAPSGESIKVSPAGIAGFGVDVAADPTNFIPVGAMAKFGAKTAGAGAKLAGKSMIGATDLLTGTRLASEGVNTVKEAAKGAQHAINKLFSPRVADDFAEMSAIATKNGIDPKVLPEAVEFGPSSVITRASRAKAEGVLGQKNLEGFAESLGKVRDATERKIHDISGGPVLSKQEAGAYIREAHDNAVESFFQTIEQSHNKIAAANPMLVIDGPELGRLNEALDGIKSFAEGRVKRGISDVQEGQGRRLLKAVDAIKATNGSYQQTVEALRDIGDAAFKSQNTLAAIPADVQKLGKLYGTINDALVGTVNRKVSPQIAEQLLRDNKAMHEFFTKDSALTKIIGNKTLSDEGVFRALIENGDSQKLQSLKAILGPERTSAIKGAWLNSLLKRDLDQSFTFGNIVGSLRNKKAVLENLLDPDEIKDFTDLIRLGDRFGNPIMSTSGTGASNVFKDVTEGIKSGVANDAFIETMKRRAREADLKGQASPQSIEAALKQAQPGIAQSLSLPSRSKTEKGLKGAQVISSQDEERKQKQSAMQRLLEKRNN